MNVHNWLNVHANDDWILMVDWLTQALNLTTKWDESQPSIKWIFNHHLSRHSNTQPSTYCSWLWYSTINWLLYKQPSIVDTHTIMCKLYILELKLKGYNHVQTLYFRIKVERIFNHYSYTCWSVRGCLIGHQLLWISTIYCVCIQPIVLHRMHWYLSIDQFVIQPSIVGAFIHQLCVHSSSSFVISYWY